MQINGLSVASVYSPKTNTESKEQSRLPAVIEATPITLGISEPSLLPAVTETTSYPSTTTVNDQQRSRFIRLLADALPANQEDVSRTNSDSIFRPLPDGVAQYLQIENLAIEPAQRLFDAIV